MDSPIIALRHAAPHQWGAGKVHRIDPGDPAKLYCGRLAKDVPGENVVDYEHRITCQNCIQRKQRQDEREKKEREWQAQREARQREWQAQRAEIDLQRLRTQADWWARYQQYLETPQWQEKRRLVLERAHGICEGCGLRRAIQAHHLTYEHVTCEFLWELRAICRDCHERFHNKPLP